MKKTRLIFVIISIVILVPIVLLTVVSFDLTDKNNLDIFLGIKEPSDYVSDDLQTLYFEGNVYQKIDIPFEMLSPRESHSEYDINFSKSEYKHSKMYTESISKRYPFVWINDTNYHVYANVLSGGITIIQLSNEDTDEVYCYCLSTDAQRVREIFNNISWNDNLLYAEYTDHNKVLLEGVAGDRLSPELSQYIINSREALLDNELSFRELTYNDSSSTLWFSIYQYDDNMNFRKKIFDIRVLKNGEYYLYDDYYMYCYDNRGQANINTNYSYLNIPTLFSKEIDKYREKAQTMQYK